MTFAISTTGPEATQALAQKLASTLHGGEVIELVSDLGGGKTTFTQGIATGLGFLGRVTSPTFTLSQIYQLPASLELHHYDLYRLAEGGIMGEELAEDLTNPSVITVVEWADVIADVLPADRLSVHFTVTGEDDRTITFTAGGKHSANLIKELKA